LRDFLARYRAWWRFLLVVGVPIVAVAILMSQASSIPQVREVVGALHDAGDEWWAIPLFVLTYVVFAIFLLPVGLLSFVAAVVWGWAAGGAIELVTSTLAAVIPYAIARGPGARWVERKLEKIGAQVPTFAGSDGAFVLLLLRIVPLLPYVALNYVAGLARVRPRDFVLTTFFGSIPSVFVFAYFVDTMADGAMGAASQLRILAACLAVAAMAIIGRALAGWLRRRMR
jgi:uncharacterized membrane protein YdjX (TVP38/TMEM64 family)